MAGLQDILSDPNYVNANAATKAAIFDKFAPLDSNFTKANPETQNAIRTKFGVSVTAEPEVRINAEGTVIQPDVPLVGGQMREQQDARQNVGAELPAFAKTSPRLYEAAVKARQMLGPTVEAGGAIGGGLIGTAGGPPGIVGGAGLGYGIAKGNAEQGYRESEYYDNGNLITSDEAITDEAKQWVGWGSSLKPAWEPIIMARKPLIGTVAQNVLEYGTGAINIDACRVEYKDESDFEKAKGGDTPSSSQIWGSCDNEHKQSDSIKPEGRWPSNVILDGSDEVVSLFPESGNNFRKSKANGKTSIFGSGKSEPTTSPNDSGSASRFFYCAKASRRDRDEGLENFEAKARQTMGSGIGGQPDQDIANNKNIHPTIKPTTLMRYLCKLVTPPNGIILDPFMGSGSTGKAAILEGFDFIGIELQEDYFEIAKARIEYEVNKNEPRPTE
jgi:hypothetical protein